MEQIRIQKWWPHLDVDAKQWLRENVRAAVIPAKVQNRIAEAGGPIDDPLLSDDDWDFVTTQSEFVD